VTFASDAGPEHGWPATSISGGGAVASDLGTPAPRHLVFKRAGLAGLTAFITINIWTGAPLLALWVGSKVVGQRALSMAAVGVVVVVLAVTVFALALALTWLNNVYDELTGRPRTERRSAWLRSMRAEEQGHISQRIGVTPLERIVVINVYVAVIAVVIWYVFFAGPPTPLL
jgi:hypothetical protein